ncbi:hypothetical protein [Jongsikchunia kroppenstedtii]|uniref:hypothetical protein n=1 Tax=Jongsikchunia kroppenstedtii TaxID=1121721 RepID=UPI0003794B2D|nr:hypothetical protein [Jongsikchunia kroppenstedtii]
MADRSDGGRDADGPSQDADIADIVRRLGELGPPDPEPIPEFAQAKIDAALATVRADTATTARGDVVSLERHRRRRRAWLIGGGAVAAVVAGVIAAVTLTGSGSSASDPTDTAQPGQPGSTPTGHQLLSIIGRTTPTPFADTDARARCLVANGYSADTPVLGTGPITVQDRQAAVILLPTGTAGRFTALVVGADCDADHPATISKDVIGG